jgi:hypothetical protein
MGMRKETRLRLVLPVRVSAENADGALFEQDCTTVDLTVNGLRVTGLTQTFRRGAIINISYGAKSVPARVMWTGKMGAESQGQAGLQVVGEWKNFWGRAIPQIPGDGFPISTYKREAKPDSKPRPNDDLAPALLVGKAANAVSQEAKPARAQFVNFLPRADLLDRMLREPRLKLQLLVRVFGMSEAGRPFVENAMTENISQNGARLTGLNCGVRKNEVLTLVYQDRKGRFRVVWSRKHDTREVFEVGLRALDLKQNFWTVDFSGITDECGPVERRVAHRYLCGGAVSIWQPGAKHFVRGTVVDLSLSGCYVEMMAPLNVRDRVVLMLSVNEIEVRAAAEVRTSHPGMGMGLKFRDLSETDRSGLHTLISRLGHSGSGQIDVRAERRSEKEVREILEDKEILQREPGKLISQ